MHRWISAVAAAIFMGLLYPVGCAADGPVNPDFEQGRIGEAPPGWIVPTEGFKASVSGDMAKQGRLCAELTRTAAAKAAATGNLMQTFLGTAFRGKRVRYRAAVLLPQSPTGARVQLWLRVNRKGGKPGFFENMNDRPMLGGLGEGWQFYEIVGDIDPDAETISLGVLLLGGAKLSIDAVSFKTLGAFSIKRPEPVRPLIARGLANLMAYTRLLGYIRHFHPSDQAAETDWETFTVASIGEVEKAAGSTELAALLQQLFAPIAPTASIYVTGKPPLASVAGPAPTGKLENVSWRHTGYGSGHDGMNVYSSERVHSPYVSAVAKDTAEAFAPIIADLGGGISCRVPVRVFADAGGTLPHRAKATQATYLSGFSGADRAVRIAGIILAWNIFQHFYPYFDVVQTDWPKALREALISAADDKDAGAFLVTLHRLVVALHDGHGNADHPIFAPTVTLPVAWDWVEESLVVTGIGVGAEALKLGDVVVSIDGEPAAEFLASKLALVSGATPQWRINRALRSVLAGDPGDEVELKVRAGTDAPRKVKLTRKEGPPIRETRPEPIAELQPGIYYVDLDRVTDALFSVVLPKLAEAKGVIFDLRGYPNRIGSGFLQHLTDKPLQSAHFEIPTITRPDRKGWTYVDSRWDLKPMAPRLKGKIAFLVGSGSISYAESVVGIVEHYKLAEIVGSPTAGTNGNINPITLPGGFRLVWTGMRVTRHDGKPHHGHGIEPTVPVSRTVEGITANRDEVLEKAIEVVSK